MREMVHRPRKILQQEVRAATGCCCCCCCCCVCRLLHAAFAMWFFTPTIVLNLDQSPKISKWRNAVYVNIMNYWRVTGITKSFYWRTEWYRVPVRDSSFARNLLWYAMKENQLYRYQRGLRSALRSSVFNSWSTWRNGSVRVDIFIPHIVYVWSN